jgi:hypothetical protein
LPSSFDALRIGAPADPTASRIRSGSHAISFTLRSATWRRTARHHLTFNHVLNRFLFDEASVLTSWCRILSLAVIAATIGPAWAEESPQPAAPPPAAQPKAEEAAPPAVPPGAHSYIVNVHDGQTLISPFRVVFGLTPNMGVAPAGVDKPNVGHHHLLIDTKLTAEQMKEPIPADAQHLHFGKGQTETTVTLPPGKHTLQLVLGNWSHVPFDPSVQSEVITVHVVAPETAKAKTPARRKAASSRRHHR